MKPFQQLLLAPVALGLVAPMAVTASELNLSDVNRYAPTASASQVTSVSQFSDVQPTDWAYQALSNLVEQYGCVAGYPNGTFKGGQAMTRYEAAALLNACLDRISEVTDELKKLMQEFQEELVLLRGRVDRMEAKVGELEATQFSTTTKLRADTRWVIGGLNYSGNQVGDNNTYKPPTSGDGKKTPFTYNQLRDAFTFNYDVRLNFDTSFTGKDLLRTTLRAGNFADSGFSSANAVTPLTNLDAAFEEACGTGTDCGDVVAINRLYYKFPVSSQFTAVIGGRMRQDDGLPVKPSVYTGDKILKLWDFNGAPGAYTQLLGPGAGLWWKQAGKTGFSFGAVYIAANGDSGQPNGTGCTSYDYNSGGFCGGIGNEASKQSGTLQLAYTGKGWNVTGAYTYNSAGVGIAGTPLSQNLLPSIYNNKGGGHVSSWSLAGYWQPLKSGWAPSFSAGWGYNSYSYTGEAASPLTKVIDLDSATSQSWFVGLNWKDLFVKGNVLGIAVGQPTFITGVNYKGSDQDVYDGNYALEAYYKFQVTDKIAVTPSIFWLSRARGQMTSTPAFAAALADPTISSGDTLGTFGALVQTTFKF
ncbi:MAG: iron uptake porin [Cyanobacteria bacterium]|nr:iron uptake porin [Cyanobacteriota bacterium]